MRTTTEKHLIRQQIRTGSIPRDLVLPPSEPLSDFICQNGIGPGPLRLAQFRAALALRATPPLYSQEGKGDEALVHVKLFDPCGSATWYLLEWDGQEEAFGYVTGLAEDEYGYVPLRELASVRGHLGIGIEIETTFLPTPLGQCRKATV
jgi:hypothetical protein